MKDTKGEEFMDCEKNELDTIINLIDTKYFNKTTGVLTIPDGTETIYGNFYYKRNDVSKLYSVKGVKIPESVNKIEKYAFRRTGLASIELPESVKEIELSAFELCSNLIEIKVNGNKVPIVQKDAFIGCENLEKFFNDSGDIDVKTDFRISNQAFSTCYKLMNSQNKWLMVVSKEDKKFSTMLNKILSLFGKLIKTNGLDSIKSKF